MKTIAIQYLEDAPHIASIEPKEVRRKLEAAFERLPISYILIGWNLPISLINTCSEVATKKNAKLYRWHPLLTGDGTFIPRPEWQTIGLSGEPVPGFKGKKEFTFVCSNRPKVREAVLHHLHDVIRSGNYQGIFLDRIRYPAPGADPVHLLACFCDDCRQTAENRGFDLEDARQKIKEMLSTPKQARAFVNILLNSKAAIPSNPYFKALKTLLDFRAHCITQFIKSATEIVSSGGLEVGLDCFSPSLTYMVAQDLKSLKDHCDWIKIMSYAHVFGPAGLPYELIGLVDWLISKGYADEEKALKWVSTGTNLSLPLTRFELSERGLCSGSLVTEIKRARGSGIKNLLAGIELVEVEGVTKLNQEHITKDLRAFKKSGADGLVLSWDLWHIPVERLDLVRTFWIEEK